MQALLSHLTTTVQSGETLIPIWQIYSAVLFGPAVLVVAIIIIRSYEKYVSHRQSQNPAKSDSLAGSKQFSIQ